MDAARLKRVLLSLADPELRVGWLAAELAGLGPGRAAELLNSILEENDAADPDAHEATLTIALVLVNHENEAFVEALREEARTRSLFSLERMTRRAPVPHLLTQPPDEMRIPDYGAGRELSLGERKALARRPDRRAFQKLCLDPHPMVIRHLVENPKMVEDDAIRIATLRPARVEVLRVLVRSHRWMARPRVRMALLHNPGSPAELVMPLLGVCTREELRDLLKSTETSIVLRGAAQELLQRKPPRPSEPPGLLH